MNVQQLIKALPVIAKRGITPNIVGQNGIGKSQIVRETFEKLGYDVIDIRLGQMADAGDLTGLHEFDRDTETGNAIATRFIPPSKLPRKGRQAVIFFDELNRAGKDLLQAIFEGVYDKRMANGKSSVVIINKPDGRWPSYLL